MRCLILAICLAWVLSGALINAFDAHNRNQDALPHQGDVSRAIDSRLDAFSLLPEEYQRELFSLSRSIEALNNDGAPSYCSLRVAAILQSCTKDRLSQEARDEAAVFLTLCDRGRDYVPPMECDAVINGLYAFDKTSLKSCAMALDQHQNFQRAFDTYRILVVPEKCKSLNSIFNVDPSREIYQNITMEFSNLLRIFAQEGMKTQEYFAQWDDRLNAMKDLRDVLGTASHPLMEFNDNLVVNMNQMVRSSSEKLREIITEAMTNGREASSMVKNDMIKAEQQHAASLASLLVSFESATSSALTALFDNFQARQNDIDSTTTLATSQLLAAVDEFSSARQDFQALGVLVREMTSKAHDQAFLLDAKHTELSESLSTIRLHLQGLASTTQALNMSLTGIKEEAIDQFSSAIQPAGVSWLQLVPVLKDLLYWMSFPRLCFLSLLSLSLPRVFAGQLLNLSLWFFTSFVSFIVRTILSHRKTAKGHDPERSEAFIFPLNFSRRSPDAARSLDEINAPHQITYSCSKTKRDTALQDKAISTSEIEKILENWKLLRTRARITDVSRVPSRLYRNSVQTPDKASARLCF